MAGRHNVCEAKLFNFVVEVDYGMWFVSICLFFYGAKPCRLMNIIIIVDCNMYIIFVIGYLDNRIRVIVQK